MRVDRGRTVVYVCGSYGVMVTIPIFMQNPPPNHDYGGNGGMVLTPEQKLATWTASAGSLVGMPMMTDDVEEPAGATNCEPPAPKRIKSDPRELRS